MTKTLYVGNLPWGTTEEELSETFGEYKVRSCRIITDRETGRSRGFGFVEIEEDVAEAAIAAMNGAYLGGREILVSEARPRQPKF